MKSYFVVTDSSRYEYDSIASAMSCFSSLVGANIPCHIVVQSIEIIANFNPDRL